MPVHNASIAYQTHNEVLSHVSPKPTRRTTNDYACINARRHYHQKLQYDTSDNLAKRRRTHHACPLRPVQTAPSHPPAPMAAHRCAFFRTLSEFRNGNRKSSVNVTEHATE
ncbi:hypothetical protein IEO21_01074 [Rhodonia placenta]|uniref:Uncharacterized protein n=1 Tax=Rhodonia placenta TaxID=104341 RepID=A0A8H7U5U0_9APHY|nr:hypothetical protein IEO21_01074 [Postia placenta]